VSFCGRSSVETGEAEVGERIGGALWRFWLLRSHLREGRRLEEVLALAGAQEPTANRVKALTALGGLHGRQEILTVAYRQGNLTA
jgi:hypothetical protein